MSSSPSYASSQLTQLFQNELLHVPSWLGQEGYETETEIWFLQHEVPSSETHKVESQINTQYQTPPGSLCAAGIPSLEFTSPNQISNKVKQLGMKNYTVQQLYAPLSIPKSERSDLSLPKSRESSSSEEAELPRPFYLPDSPPSGRSPPGTGSYRKEECSLSQNEQYASLSRTQMVYEYEDLFQGPISNEEFLERLRLLDEHWDAAQFEVTTAKIAVVTPVQLWYKAYIEENPEMARLLAQCTTEQERETIMLEIQNDYLNYELRANKIMEDALMKYNRPEVEIDPDVAYVARIFQWLVKGKYPENEDSDETKILKSNFLEEEVAEFARTLSWYYKMMKEYFDGRFQQCVLDEVGYLVGLGNLEERSIFT